MVYLEKKDRKRNAEVKVTVNPKTVCICKGAKPPPTASKDSQTHPA